MAIATAPTPFVLKDVELSFGINDYRHHVSSVTFTPTSSIVQWRGLSPASLHTDTSLATWTVTIEVAQDWAEQDSLSRFLYEHEGERTNVRFRPVRGDGPVFTAEAVVVSGGIGGTIDAVAVQSVTMPLTARPFIVSSTTYDTGAGNAWAIEYSGGTNTFDSSMKVEGTGSIKMQLPSSAVAGGMSTPITSLDASKRTFKLWMRSDNWANVDGVQLQLFNDPSAGYDAFTYNLKQYNIDLVNNEWFEIQIPKQFWNTMGSPSWDRPIQKIAVMAYTKVGSTATVWVNNIQSFPTFEPRGKVSITFDDGWLTSYTEGASAMRARGMVGSFFIIKELLGQPERMTQAQVDELHSAGFDIGAHGEFNLATLTEAQRDADLKKQRDYLNSKGYRGRNIYAYPEGVNNNAIRRDVKQQFDAARTTNFANQPTGYISPFRINSYSPLAGDALSRLKGYVDAAEATGDWAIFCMHKIVDNAVEHIDYDKQDFIALLDYIATKNVDVVPMSAMVG